MTGTIEMSGEIMALELLAASWRLSPAAEFLARPHQNINIEPDSAPTKHSLSVGHDVRTLKACSMATINISASRTGSGLSIWTVYLLKSSLSAVPAPNNATVREHSSKEVGLCVEGLTAFCSRLLLCKLNVLY